MAPAMILAVWSTAAFALLPSVGYSPLSVTLVAMWGCLVGGSHILWNSFLFSIRTKWLLTINSGFFVHAQGWSAELAEISSLTKSPVEAVNPLRGSALKALSS